MILSELEAETSSDRHPDSENQKYNANFFHYSQPIIFQVEDELFQLPKSLLPHSDILVETYPALENRSAKTVMIKLYNCRKTDIEAFLTWLLRPLASIFKFPHGHPCSESPTLDTLLNALHFGEQWGFLGTVSDLTLYINKILSGPFQRIVFGKLHRVVLWFRAGLEELVDSDEDIEIEDAKGIGFELSLQIYHARSKVRKLLDQDASNSDQLERSKVVARVVAEMFIDKVNPWTSLECHLAGTESTVEEEQGSQGASLYNSLEGEEETASQSEFNDSDIAFEGLGYADDTSIEILQTEGDDGLEECGVVDVPQALPDEKTVRELVTAILSGTKTSSRHLLSAVPKKCADKKKKNKQCGNLTRCRKCCIRQLRVYQPIPGSLTAKTPLGQVLLDRLGEIYGGSPICLEIVLKNVKKSCRKTEKTCGSSRRCSKCCKRAAKAMLGNGEII
ncbi:hypothetical protein L218DRAFT_998913 [Marasmius fiardii PR-910]|nr:hypothetical protein L218DRAFT_998913 [Marasmius fiardii PR-910]